MGGICVRTELIPRKISKLKHHAEVASEAKHPLVYLYQHLKIVMKLSDQNIPQRPEQNNISFGCISNLY